MILSLPAVVAFLFSLLLYLLHFLLLPHGLPNRPFFNFLLSRFTTSRLLNSIITGAHLSP